MANKAYIVASKQQEQEVLDKLEEKGALWGNGKNATNFIPFSTFPYVIYCNGDKYIFWDKLGDLDVDKIIAFDGRNEEQMSEKYVVSQEFMDKLEEWRDNEDLNATSGKSYNYINDNDLGKLPDVAEVWWFGDKDPIERNKRLIAIIRWLNGEDVFEVKPKKWVVRSKNVDSDGETAYVDLVDNVHAYVTNSLFIATRFDTKEEAQSWANSHQEVVEVGE